MKKKEVLRWFASLVVSFIALMCLNCSFDFKRVDSKMVARSFILSTLIVGSQFFRMKQKQKTSVQ